MRGTKEVEDLRLSRAFFLTFSDGFALPGQAPETATLFVGAGRERELPSVWYSFTALN